VWSRRPITTPAAPISNGTASLGSGADVAPPELKLEPELEPPLELPPP